jgi:phage terminase small subunit
MADDTPALTPRQRRFVDEYLISLNATQAAIRAGYSARNAESIGYQLLQKTPVRAAVEAGQQALSRQAQVHAYQVVRELALVAFADVTAFTFDAVTGAVSAPPDRPEMTRALAAVRRRVRNTLGGREVDVEIRLWPKVEALQLLGQHLGLFKDKGDAGDGPPYKVYLDFDPREILHPPDARQPYHGPISPPDDSGAASTP